MSKNIITIDVSFSQLCVFSGGLKQPFNEWSERAFSQGFACRSGSASFRTLKQEGEHKISVYENEDDPDISKCCVRSVRVPFQAADGKIEIASISDSVMIKVNPGDYILQVEFLDSSNELYNVNLRLNSGDCIHEILKADEEINTEGGLELSAKPAD